MKRAGSNKSDVNAPAVRARRIFSDEFKREALALARQRRNEHRSWAQIGRELDIRPTLLFQWAQQLEGDRGPREEAARTGLPGETLEEENRRLRRENAILREEREFAKKAA